jgi:2-polyprenyl-6-methoxyphenol hydroxylase-like FAD-dependent oxidoreductase
VSFHSQGSDTAQYTNIKLSHGYRGHIFHRRDLLKALYDSLPEESRAKVLVNKRVIAIETTANGVTVRSDDGGVEQGTIVLGADGAHSKVRDIMRDLALARSSDAVVNAEQPYLTTYRVMFGNAPLVAGVENGEVYEAHGDDASSQVFVGNGRMWFFIYKRLANPTKTRASYTEKDMIDYAEEMGGKYVLPGHTLREIFAKRNGAGLTNLEEGIVENWSWDRIVLVGDAAHKVTPNIGWGYNSGIQDLVALINRLRPLMTSQQAQDLTTAKFQDVFKAYQKERMEFMVKIVDISGTVTRQTAWNGWAAYILDRFAFHVLDVEKLVTHYVLGPMVSQIPVLDFLRENHFIQGKIPWVHLPVA